jgi:hypothetical protein
VSRIPSQLVSSLPVQVLAGLSREICCLFDDECDLDILVVKTPVLIDPSLVDNLFCRSTINRENLGA